MPEKLLKKITPEESYLIREETIYHHDKDFENSTLHLGAFLDRQLVGVATIVEQSPPHKEMMNAWQIWRIVILPTVIGQGYDIALLQACVGYAAGKGGDLIWCIAGAAERALYDRHGFANEVTPDADNPTVLMLRIIYPDDKHLTIEGKF